ncbi:helix-turn-helix domain-containing protein [Paenibacillus kobensis]|uniref:helix-turn-helix domain-containing protein n=1 Tax=Paenibacillus kobensis TaxID=59841 RepID=UPI000FD8DD26|nr:helix-turn-helix domain-containing protein [Paenibacillus kobensis]
MHYSKHVQEAINYIHANLSAEITLAGLADHVHFSPYHFHRLFLLCTGEAPMKYVRRLRLRAASQELISKQLNIIEIAAKYKFESQDGFCRAFKKYYGLTPGDYKKLNDKMADPKLEEVSTIIYDMRIYENLTCSHDEKREALRTLEKVLELSDKAQQSGLLSLEPEMERVYPEFFKKSIQLLIDGIEPKSLREILQNYVLCGGYRGKELLIRILIMEAMLSIQEGVHTVVLREKLSSFFGDDFIEEMDKHFGLDRESQRKKLETFIAENENRSAVSKETSLLEEPISRMDDRSLQRLLRDIDEVTLVTAMCGGSGKIQAKLLKNVSNKRALVMMDGINTVGTPAISDMAISQKRVLETMHSLRNQGDIVI